MKDDLISRSALLAKLDELFMAALRKTGESVETIYQLDHLAMLVKDAPAVDAEPVRHGKWEEPYPYDAYDCYKCSCCGVKYDRTWDYCPNCGAKMDGDEDAAD